MPIYIYECPAGHRTEFLKLKKDEEEPKYCKVYCYQGGLDGECGLPLTKVIAPTNWKYTRGKNPTWPLTDPVEDPRPREDEIIPKEPT